MSKKQKIKKALAEAIAAIWFNDNSDYLSTLWYIVAILDPKAALLLEKNTHAAYDKYALDK